jgi:hypothetical protein
VDDHVDTFQRPAQTRFVADIAEEIAHRRMIGSDPLRHFVLLQLVA